MSDWARRAQPALVVFLSFGVARAATPLGAQTVPVAVTDFAFTPPTVTTALGSIVRWDFGGFNLHTSTDETSLRLWDSGTKGAGGTFSFTFVAAGTYAYVCTFHATLMTGTVAIPITASPASAPLGSTVTVTWASVAIPIGFVVDVEVDPPGPGGFRPIQTGTTAPSGSGVPPIKGKYVFRARLRRTSTGGTSQFSPTATITIT